MFEKRRRRRESHNAVERRRRDNINERIHGNVLSGAYKHTCASYIDMQPYRAMHPFTREIT